MITWKRIVNVKPHLERFETWEILYISIKYSDKIKNKLLEIWFNKIEEWFSILPRYKGKASNINSDWFEKVRKDLPKIEYIHELPYSLKDFWWHLHEWINYIPRLKYQRELIDAMWIYLNIESKNWELMIISDPIDNKVENEFKFKNTINLFLEIFWEANITNDTFEIFTRRKVIKYNFEFLKKWEYPWEKTKEIVFDSIWKKYWDNTSKVITNRWDIIEKYNPDFIWYWLWWFGWYICFWFKEKELYILESSFLNNATYIFGKDWEDISKLTKALIIKWILHKYRIIHWNNWEIEVEKLLK